MMRCVTLLLATVLVWGCDSQSEAEKAAADARDVAAVEAVNHAPRPREPLALLPIEFPDIQQARLYGKGCAFVGSAGGAIAMTEGQRALIKTGDGLVVFASDPGSAAMPLGTWSRYSGKAFALSLTREGSGDAASPGKLVITDVSDQVVFEASGTVQCKG